MITKGIIKQLNTDSSNYYHVYIPLFRKANDSENDAIFKATRLCISGIENDLKIDDIVYLGFEDGEFDRPVILGKLYMNNNTDDIKTNIIVKSLKVIDKTTITGETKINDLDIEDINRKLNSVSELEDN